MDVLKEKEYSAIKGLFNLYVLKVIIEWKEEKMNEYNP